MTKEARKRIAHKAIPYQILDGQLAAAPEPGSCSEIQDHEDHEEVQPAAEQTGGNRATIATTNFQL